MNRASPSQKASRSFGSKPRWWCHAVSPCDPADAKTLSLRASLGRAGPWAELVRWTANCSTRWEASPPFNATEVRYLQVHALANNGYDAGTRIPEVNFFASELPCAGRPDRPHNGTA